MWKAISTIVEPLEIIQYRITDQHGEMSIRRVIDLLVSDNAFRLFYNRLLAECSFEAFYWEHPPVTVDRLDDSYTFVLVNSKALLRVTPEPDTFKSHFSGEGVVVFPNLGGDALLIVPTPIAEHVQYAHLGDFVRHAPPEQIDQFWKKAGETWQGAIGADKKWLSTAGLGVYWLHLRIDSRPKYYKFQPYKG